MTACVTQVTPKGQRQGHLLLFALREKEPSVPTRVVSSRHNAGTCSYLFELATGERIVVSIARHPAPSIKIVRQSLFGTIPRRTIWEYSREMLREPAEFMDVIGTCLFERSSSIRELRCALVECEIWGRPPQHFFAWSPRLSATTAC